MCMDDSFCKYIEQRIKQLEEQLSSAECNNPIKVEHKLEAYNEIILWMNTKKIIP